MPKFHQIYIDHYGKPFPFENSFLKKILFPATSPTVNKKSLDNNFLGLYLYLIYKKTGELNNVKHEAGSSWRQELATEMVNGVKGRNCVRLNELYSVLTQHYKPKAQPKIETYANYLKGGHLFGFVKKERDKTNKAMQDSLKKALAQLRDISKTQPLIDIDDLLDEWEKDIAGVVSDDKRHWRKSLFDDLT